MSFFVIWRCALRKNVSPMTGKNIKPSSAELKYLFFDYANIANTSSLFKHLRILEYKSSDRVLPSVRWIESFTQYLKSQYTDISRTHTIPPIEKKKKKKQEHISYAEGTSRCEPQTHVFRTSVLQGRLRVELQPRRGSGKKMRMYKYIYFFFPPSGASGLTLKEKQASICRSFRNKHATTISRYIELATSFIADLLPPFCSGDARFADGVLLRFQFSTYSCVRQNRIKHDTQDCELLCFYDFWNSQSCVCFTSPFCIQANDANN